MISRLPRWVEVSAFLLALLAGSVNAVGLLGFQHQSVSHLSGTATLMGVELISLASGAWHLGGVLLSFLAGAIVSGVLLGNTALKLGRHYGFALILEGALLLTAMVMLQQGSLSGHYLASAACGLQNAMVTTYSGALIRTTHVTGLFTDLGIMIGLRLRGQPFDRRKALLYMLLIGGFIVGGALGAVLFGLFAFAALSVPGMMAIALAVSYAALARMRRKGGA